MPKTLKMATLTPITPSEYETPNKTPNAPILIYNIWLQGIFCHNLHTFGVLSTGLKLTCFPQA